VTKTEFEARENNLIDTYKNWFQDDHLKIGMYQIDYMPGWLEIIEELFSSIAQVLTPEDATNFKINQIKEKFGGLRFYYSGQGIRVDIQTGNGLVSMQEKTENSNLSIDTLIGAAEKKSQKTCIYCGDEGVLRVGGWVRVTCDKHEQMRAEGKTLEESFEEFTTPAKKH